MLQSLKQIILSAFPVSGDAIFLLAGLATFLMSSAILKHPLHRAWSLLACLAVAVLIEGFDIVNHYTVAGFFGSEPKLMLEILARHAKDVVVFVLAPVLVVIAARFIRR